MDNKKVPIEIKEELLPEDTFKNAKVSFDEKKRTAGGFVDAMFLSSIILTSFLWLLLLLIKIGSR